MRLQQYIPQALLASAPLSTEQYGRDPSPREYDLAIIQNEFYITSQLMAGLPFFAVCYDQWAAEVAGTAFYAASGQIIALTKAIATYSEFSDFGDQEIAADGWALYYARPALQAIDEVNDAAKVGGHRFDRLLNDEYDEYDDYDDDYDGVSVEESSPDNPLIGVCWHAGQLKTALQNLVDQHEHLVKEFHRILPNETARIEWWSQELGSHIHWAIGNLTKVAPETIEKKASRLMEEWVF